jgi:phospholipase/carboxylesterase
MFCLLPWTSSGAAPRTALDYVERTIDAEPGARLPLVVAMHGLGATPESLLSLYDGLGVPVRIIAPRAPDPWQVGSSWYPVDQPERAPLVVKQRTELVLALVKHVRKHWPTVGLPIVTGFSQGGVMSFALAAYHPQRIAAALPLAGWLWPSLTGFRKAPTGFRVTALHGKDDQRIQFDKAEQTVARLRAAGTEATLSGFDGVGHEVSPELLARYHAALREEISRVRR